MEAVGRLAGGIAHDFNNLLTVILGHAELLASDGTLSAASPQCVDQIRNATTSAATVTRQLLMLSRKGIKARRHRRQPHRLGNVEK